jgi:hypothetical protein
LLELPTIILDDDHGFQYCFYGNGRCVGAVLEWPFDSDSPLVRSALSNGRDPVLANLTAVLHAWRAAFGVDPVTVRKATEEAERREELRDALMSVAGRSGKIDGRALGNWLAGHAADRVVNLGEDLAPEPVAMVRSGERQGVALRKLTARTVG